MNLSGLVIKVMTARHWSENANTKYLKHKLVTSLIQAKTICLCGHVL